MFAPMIRLLILLLAASTLFARGPVYVLLWFDTEDYIDPAADDAALRIANDLSSLGIHATFKVVGEKARVLEARKRQDVIQALRKHTIGYHSNWHSVHPTPSEYLREFGYVEGVAEFERREAPGIADIKRIFGVLPVCYGQPGSSWGPQSESALRSMGVPVYLDEGEQVGLNDEPFWYGGLLHVFHMGKNQLRADLKEGADMQTAYARFDEAAARLAAGSGGVISIYYHPTEFVNIEFWDAVNFAKGAMPPRRDWRPPHPRTKEDAARCYRVLHDYAQHMTRVPGVKFVTAADLPKLYQPAIAGSDLPEKKLAADQLRREIVFLESGNHTYSPADLLLQLLGLPPQVVDGPTAATKSSWAELNIPDYLFEAARKDAMAFIQRNHRLPNQVFLGAKTLSLEDFAATLASTIAFPEKGIPVVRGTIGFNKYFSTDARGAFSWPIHPTGFAAPELLAMGRLQGWTLKPARLR